MERGMEHSPITPLWVGGTRALPHVVQNDPQLWTHYRYVLEVDQFAKNVLHALFWRFEMRL